MISESHARPDPGLTKTALAVCIGLLVVQLLVAGRLELMFDEAYYRLWAEHLAWGYHDHPPLIALWVRVSTTLFGGTEFGIRALGVLATALGSLAIWLMARELFESRQTAALAVMIWSAAPLVGVGGMLVTPDTPLLFGWTTSVWALSRLYRSDDWRWWLVVGAAAGVALEAKYTALFLGPGIVLAMLVVPGLRKWWRHPAPYLGGLLALAVFSPNIIWNARHGWETFVKQFGRVGETEWTVRFLFEFFGSQIGLINPLSFVLVVAGLVFAWKPSGDGYDGSRRLLVGLALPLLAFFAFHSLHDRVQGNWLAPLYPIFALLAADAAETTRPLDAWAARLIAFARRWTVPLGLTLTAIIYAQALLAPLPIAARGDPTALLAGWRDLARDLGEQAKKEGAAYILTQNYALTALLKVYDPGGVPVMQFNERTRWAYDPTEPSPDPARVGLYITEVKRSGQTDLLSRFAQVRQLDGLERRRHGKMVENYVVYRLEAPTAPILDPVTKRLR